MEQVSGLKMPSECIYLVACCNAVVVLLVGDLNAQSQCEFQWQNFSSEDGSTTNCFRKFEAASWQEASVSHLKTIAIFEP